MLVSSEYLRKLDIVGYLLVVDLLFVTLASSVISQFLMHIMSRYYDWSTFAVYIVIGGCIPFHGMAFSLSHIHLHTYTHV